MHPSLPGRFSAGAMGPWANPVVARLAVGEGAAADLCGMVLVCSWPMPPDVLQAYERFRADLAAAMPSEAYVYPGSTLHCTVMTLRAFTAGPMDEAVRRTMRGLWSPVLRAARAMEAWPAGPFSLRLGPPTLEGAAGIFRYEDVDGAVGRMRGCLREAVRAAGGCAAEGLDWSQAMPLPGTPEGQIAPQVPNIVHSTVLRWIAEPPDREAAKVAFDGVAKSWQPVNITVPRVTAVWEDVPYMHIPLDETHVWWDSEAEPP